MSTKTSTAMSTHEISPASECELLTAAMGGELAVQELASARVDLRVDIRVDIGEGRKSRSGSARGGQGRRSRGGHVWPPCLEGPGHWRGHTG